MCVTLSWETHLTEMQKFPGLVRHPRITNSPMCLFIRNSTASPRVASSWNHLQKRVLCSWLSDASNMQVHTPTSQCCKSKTILPLGLSCMILTSIFGLFKTLNEILSSKVWKCRDFSGTFLLLKECAADFWASSFLLRSHFKWFAHRMKRISAFAADYCSSVSYLGKWMSRKLRGTSPSSPFISALHQMLS